MSRGESPVALSARTLPRGGCPAGRFPPRPNLDSAAISPKAQSHQGSSPEIPARLRPEVGDAAFEARLREAELEAREYLERAKKRADSLVATMVQAIEREAAAIRRDADESIRARWSQVETDAQHHLEEARRVGDAMLAERQQRIAALSDGITGKAEALSSGVEDANRIRGQFEAFVRALSDTADRIAREPARSGSRISTEVRLPPRNGRSSAIAA